MGKKRAIEQASAGQKRTKVHAACAPEDPIHYTVGIDSVPDGVVAHMLSNIPSLITVRRLSTRCRRIVDSIFEALVVVRDSQAFGDFVECSSRIGDTISIKIGEDGTLSTGDHEHGVKRTHVSCILDRFIATPDKVLMVDCTELGVVSRFALPDATIVLAKFRGRPTLYALAYSRGMRYVRELEVTVLPSEGTKVQALEGSINVRSTLADFEQAVLALNAIHAKRVTFSIYTVRAGVSYVLVVSCESVHAVLGILTLEDSGKVQTPEVVRSRLEFWHRSGGLYSRDITYDRRMYQ